MRPPPSPACSSGRRCLIRTSLCTICCSSVAAACIRLNEVAANQWQVALKFLSPHSLVHYVTAAAATVDAAQRNPCAATSSKAVIYDVDIATRARNYGPVCGENLSDGSLQGSCSVGEARVINKLFHRDQIINTDADSHHLNSSPAVSTNDTGRRANDKNRGPKNPGSEASVRRDHGTKSDTHRLETDQKRESDLNTAQRCKDAGAGLEEPVEREKARMCDHKNRLTSDPIITSNGKVMNYEQFKVQQMQDESLAEIWQKAKAGHPRFFISDKGILFSKTENAGWEDHAAGNVLVAPMACREQILNLAHTHLLGGHMGINKTRDRIRRQFWFPKI